MIHHFFSRTCFLHFLKVYKIYFFKDSCEWCQGVDKDIQLVIHACFEFLESLHEHFLYPIYALVDVAVVDFTTLTFGHGTFGHLDVLSVRDNQRDRR